MPLPQKLPPKSTLKTSDSSSEVLANRYIVQRTLGCGTCGTALLVVDRKAKDEREKQKVAKKIFVGNLLACETVDADKESSLLRNLDHPGIVKFYDSFIEGEFYCLVTEFCDGGDLDQRVVECRANHQTFSEAQVTDWIIQILLALQYMHSRRILHRDLKTRNIFLRAERIKIGDFGISRIMMGTLDVASTFVGTPYYMSPEVLKHEGYNSKSDIWSAGCILYELTSLRHAFEASTLMGIMYKITEVDTPQWPPGYSAELGDLYHRMMSKDPDDRPTAGDALHLPFVTRHMEVLQNTIIDKHYRQDKREIVRSDVEKITKALYDVAVSSDKTDSSLPVTCKTHGTSCD